MGRLKFKSHYGLNKIGRLNQIFNLAARNASQAGSQFLRAGDRHDDVDRIRSERQDMTSFDNGNRNAVRHHTH